MRSDIKVWIFIWQKRSHWTNERSKGTKNMSMLVTTGASMSCTFGAGTATFQATTNPMVLCGGKVVGTIQDAAAGVNIPPFGMCTTLSNPAVAAATAAALGVLTPVPCTPIPTSWTPSQLSVLSGGKPCLTQDCQCMCSYGGTIAFTSPGQTNVIVK